MIYNLVCAQYIFCALSAWANPICGPLPYLSEDISNVGDICLTGRGVDNALNGDAKE